MKFSIVLEVVAKQYALNGKAYFNEYYENKISRAKYWSKCIAESELGQLEPIKAGSNFVEIENLNDQALAMIIKTQLETGLEKKISQIDWVQYKDEGVFLNGGIVLKQENQVIIEPMCCTDLGDIDNWLEIEAAPNNAWVMLWIGHPWVYYRKIDEIIEFSDYLENAENAIPKYQFNLAELYAALEKIMLEREQFTKRVQHVLEQLKVEDSIEMAQLITGRL